jgi:uncharacterized membrane protein
MTTEADRRVKNYSEAAESMEIERRNIEKNAATAQREKEEAIANVYKMAGKISATTFFKSQAEFFNLVMLKKVKDSREYRERFGMTWEQFCEHVGVNRRTVDRQLDDLEPFRQDFLDTLSNFSGVTINKIKYLGMAVDQKTANVSENAITYAGETIPLDAEHKDDIQALLENLEIASKQGKEELEAALSAQKKIAAAKEKVINKMERDLKRLERTVEKTDLTEEEQEALNLLVQVQTDFMLWISDIKKKIEPGKAPQIALRQLYYLYILISKMAMEERLALQEFYQNAEEVPWEITEMELPPAEILIDNLPRTAGRGMGAKVKAKMEGRQAARDAKKGNKSEKDN